MRQPDHVLILRDVAVYRGRRCVIPPLSLNLAPGDVLGVLGPNGAGKTSLLAACTGDMPVHKGEIRYGNTLLNPNDALRFARLRAVLPQQSQLSFNLPVHQIVRMGAYPFQDILPAQVLNWVEEAMDDVELLPYAGQSYSALSGGEQQRVQFARVMVQTRAIVHTRGHAYLFLDEPTASLDLRHQARLIKTVQALTKKQLVSVFVVLHDLNMAARWCDTILLLSTVHAPFQGKTAEVLTDETLRKVYGVAMHVQPHPFRPNALLILSDA